LTKQRELNLKIDNFIKQKPLQLITLFFFNQLELLYAKIYKGILIY